MSLETSSDQYSEEFRRRPNGDLDDGFEVRALDLGLAVHGAILKTVDHEMDRLIRPRKGIAVRDQPLWALQRFPSGAFLKYVSLHKFCDRLSFIRSTSSTPCRLQP